jgi:hypothetical protein
VFGVSLEKACHGRDVPRIVDDCVALLSQRGVKEPNIFCSAICSSTQLNELRTLYNSGADVNIFEYDVSVVAELLLVSLLFSSFLPLSSVSDFSTVFVSDLFRILDVFERVTGTTSRCVSQYGPALR